MRTTTALLLALPVVLVVCRAAASTRGAAGARLPRSEEPATQACRRDQSGIDWTLPFQAARARAEAEQRLLFIKPIAFGTSSDGGW